MRILLILIFAVAGTLITVSGYETILYKLCGVELGFLKTWLLSLAISFLRTNPLIKQRSWSDMENIELWATLIVCLLLDIIAVYAILPYVF